MFLESAAPESCAFQHTSGARHLRPAQLQIVAHVDERGRHDARQQQEATALKIEKAMKLAEMEEPPPKMPSDKDMADPRKMQEYMLQMGEYSARQQLKLSAMEQEVRENLTSPCIP